ncbi:hypothetical protein IKQ26_02585 [bacterium]|nr:hypothetical protein [bacterium]
MKKKNYNDHQPSEHQEFINRHEIMEKIMPIVDNTLMRYGFLPVEVDLAKENHRWFLRIFIYSPEKSVTLDDCENISRSMSDFLDELIPFKFNLEISSPGIERKIKSDREYLIFKGKDILLKLKTPIDDTPDTNQIVARIVDFDENEGLKVFLYKDKQEHLIKREQIINARLYSSEI